MKIITSTTGLETAGAYVAKKWDVFARGASGERFKDAKVDLGRVAVANGKKVRKEDPPAAAAEEEKTEEEPAAEGGEPAAPAPAPAVDAAPEATQVTPPANADEAAAIQELNADIEQKRKEDELNQKLAAQEAKQKYEECVNNCQLEKEEAESGLKTCCNGDWYRYLCFCYAGTCCA